PWPTRSPPLRSSPTSEGRRHRGSPSRRCRTHPLRSSPTSEGRRHTPTDALTVAHELVAILADLGRSAPQVLHALNLGDVVVAILADLGRSAPRCLNSDFKCSGHGAVTSP